jgi:D-3-phosphoglycerate dehydrogenase
VQHTVNGGWSRDLFKGHELFGKTAGIVGYGRLGQLVGWYLGALGMKVVATDPKVTAAEVPLIPLDELLAAADIVTLHVQLDASTVGMFGERQFSRMKAGALFVNTSRGELVDEAALERALGSGGLGGAALDVLCGENSAGMGSHPLVAYARCHDNLLITPHIGGCTDESMRKCEEFMAGRVAEWLREREAGSRGMLQCVE